MFIFLEFANFSSCAKDERKTKEQNERPRRILSYERLKSTDSKRSASFHSSARLAFAALSWALVTHGLTATQLQSNQTRPANQSGWFLNVRFDSRRSGARAHKPVRSLRWVLSVNRFRYVASALRLITQLCCQHSKSDPSVRVSEMHLECVSECNLAVIV